LLPEDIKKLGVEETKRIIFNGTAGGMQAWGSGGTLTEKQIDLMACYLREKVPYPDEE
jgi:mono/diheme cytochrome c family protein